MTYREALNGLVGQTSKAAGDARAIVMGLTEKNATIQSVDVQGRRFVVKATHDGKALTFTSIYRFWAWEGGL